MEHYRLPPAGAQAPCRRDPAGRMGKERSRKASHRLTPAKGHRLLATALVMVRLLAGRLRQIRPFRLKPIADRRSDIGRSRVEFHGSPAAIGAFVRCSISAALPSVEDRGNCRSQGAAVSDRPARSADRVPDHVQQRCDGGSSHRFRRLTACGMPISGRFFHSAYDQTDPCAPHIDRFDAPNTARVQLPLRRDMPPSRALNCGCSRQPARAGECH